MFEKSFNGTSMVFKVLLNELEIFFKISLWKCCNPKQNFRIARNSRDQKSFEYRNGKKLQVCMLLYLAELLWSLNICWLVFDYGQSTLGRGQAFASNGKTYNFDSRSEHYTQWAGALLRISIDGFLNFPSSMDCRKSGIVILKLFYYAIVFPEIDELPGTRGTHSKGAPD